MGLIPYWTSTRGKLKDIKRKPRRKGVTFVNHDKLEKKSVSQEGDKKPKENNFP